MAGNRSSKADRRGQRSRGARSIREDPCIIVALSCRFLLAFLCRVARRRRGTDHRHARRAASSTRSGGALPGVTVTARHTDTGFERAAISDAAGPLRAAGAASRATTRCAPSSRASGRSCAAASRLTIAQTVGRSTSRWTVGGVAEAVTVVGRGARRQHAQRRAQLSRRSTRDRAAAAERPQLHRPRAAAAGRRAVSASRRRIGRRARARHERQRPGSARRTSTCSTARCSTT